MKRAIFITAFVWFACLPAMATNDPTMQQTLLSAMQSGDITADQPSSFQLDIDFVIDSSAPTPGHLTLKWAAKDRWWREVTVGDFRQTEVRNGPWRYIARNLSFTPIRIGNLFDLLGFDQITEEWVATKERHRVDHGIEVNCIQAKSAISSGQSARLPTISHELCISSASNDIVSDESQQGLELRVKKYDDYGSFLAHRYPHRSRLLINGRTVITAQVASLKEVSFDKSQFTPPPGAIDRRDCDGIRPPSAIKTPAVSFPSSARAIGGGDIAVAMTVLSDGTVSDIRLMGSSGIPLDAATIKTLKSYRFKPAMCGTEPVTFDVTIDLSFTLR